MDTNFISTVLNKKLISTHFAVKLVVGERGDFTHIEGFADNTVTHNRPVCGFQLSV